MMIRFRSPLWSLISGVVFIVSLVLTLLSVAGLDTPLSHSLAGAAAFMVRNLNRFFQRLLTIFFNANQPEKQGNSSPDA